MLLGAIEHTHLRLGRAASGSGDGVGQGPGPLEVAAETSLAGAQVGDLVVALQSRGSVRRGLDPEALGGILFAQLNQAFIAFVTGPVAAGRFAAAGFVPGVR